MYFCDIMMFMYISNKIEEEKRGSIRERFGIWKNLMSIPLLPPSLILRVSGTRVKCSFHLIFKFWTWKKFRFPLGWEKGKVWERETATIYTKKIPELLISIIHNIIWMRSSLPDGESWTFLKLSVEIYSFLLLLNNSDPEILLSL